MRATLIGLLPLVWLYSGYGLQYPFTPEDASFAFGKCQNISTAGNNLKLKWASWRFPNNKQTHCYVKCFLEKLGLIDLITRGIDPTKLMIQNDLQSEDGLWNELGNELSGTCNSYYTAWTSLLENYSKVLAKAFYAYPEDTESFYENDPHGAKRKGLTAVEFCNRLYDKESANQPEPNRDTCYMQCIFQHFRYFDAYGRLDRNEIILGIKANNENNQSDLEACVHRGNQLYSYGLCRVAEELYKCLASKVKKLNDFFKIRNSLTAFY